MYKVSEVAQQCGVSTTAIYKGLKQVGEQFQTKFEGKTLVTEEGLPYFLEKYKPQKPASDEVLLSLIRQLEEKDRQLKEKDKQIESLHQILQQQNTLALADKGTRLQLIGELERDHEKMEIDRETPLSPSSENHVLNSQKLWFQFWKR